MFVTLLLVTAFTLASFTIYRHLKWRREYWSKRNVPHLKPLPIVGNSSDYILLKKHSSEVTHDLCRKLPNAPVFGTFFGTEPALVVQDPDLIKLVMTKDFNYFTGREITKYVDREVLIKNLFFAHGDQWKVLRQNLSPLFSTAKMKNMFHLIEKCSHVFENVLNQEMKDSNVIEAKTFMARFTMDCIGSCAFGVDTNTMDKNEDNPFTVIGNKVFSVERYQAWKNILRTLWPAIFYGLGFQTFPSEVENFFRHLLTGVFESRQYKPSNRNDFVDLILKLKTKVTVEGSYENMKNNSGEQDKLDFSEDMLVAQCLLFFTAGYETSATTLSYTLFELAKNPKAQQKALDEVDEYLRRNGNVIKYECVSEMPYVDACFDEALRLYPVLGLLTREVTEDYVFPNGLRVDKGVRIHIPVSRLHNNPDYFPEPQQYRPERFFAEEKRNIKPYTYMPFGEGQRICIGMRFAKMQMTAGLITLLKKYRIELADGMKESVSLEPKAFVNQPVGGINLKLIEREGWEGRMLQSAQLS